MNIRRRTKRFATDNGGISLVELIVVIAIIAVLTGVASFGIGLMFTRDASYVAVRIDDELAEARTLSMSRSGTTIYELHIDASDPYNRSEITIYNTTDETLPKSSWTVNRNVLLDKSVKIEVSDGASYSATSGDVLIIFDQAKGTVKKVGGNSATGKVYTITVTSQKNTSKVNKITLVGDTGRHFTEK